MSRPIIYLTPCTHLDINRLQSDIKEAVPLVNATLKVDDNLYVHSVIELIQSDKDLVDAIIVAFVDTDPAVKIPLIMGMAKAEAHGKHFHNINYKMELTSALIPLRTVMQGEVREVTWYASIGAGNIPVNPIIKVTIAYTRDLATSLPIYRTTTRQWYNIDGTLNEESKVTMKFYYINPSDQIEEGDRRRDLLVKSIQIPVMNMMVEVLTGTGLSIGSILLKGRQFLDDYKEEFDRFVSNSSTVTDPADEDNYGKKTVIVKLESEDRTEVKEWMDLAPNSLGGATTIRQYLIGEFDI